MREGGVKAYQLIQHEFNGLNQLKLTMKVHKYSFTMFTNEPAQGCTFRLPSLHCKANPLNSMLAVE